MATIVKNIITDNCNCKNPDVKIEGDCQPPVVDVGSEDAFNDYNYLINKPSINGNVLSGDKTGEDLGLVDAEEGKGLSTNDFTDDYKNKLDHIEPEAQRNVQSDWDQQDNTKDDFIKNKPTKVSVFENDADYDTQTGVRTKISIHNTSDDAHLDIRQSVINETNRAKYAENEIAALINGESAERQAADARLQESINVERDTRILGDTILQDNIDNEAVLRRDADNRLQTNINSEAVARQTADNQLQANINNEIANRQTADSVLQDQIDTFNSRLVTEKNERQQADSTLQTNIDNERIRAEAAEGVLNDKIDQEIVDRTEALQGFQDQLDAEVLARTNADTALGNRITAETNRAEGVEGSLTNLSTSSKTNLVSAINEVNSNVTAERQRAEGAETALGTRITNETTAREQADTELGNRITGETNRATGVEGTLSNLTTSTKTNLVNAINEVDAHTDTNTSDIADIKELIPGEATSSNQLADKDFVNSSIATQTGNFIGTFANIPARDAYTGTVTNNDYCFVMNSVIKDNGNDWASFAALDAYDKSLVTNFDYAWVIDGSKFDLYRFDVVNQVWDKKAEDVTKEEITLNNAYNRYKAIVTTSPASLTWEYEYTLNNSSFTASQWAAINSGATTGKINQITTNQNSIGTLSSLTTDAKTNLVAAINELDGGKVDANSSITGATKCKITYDSKGLVTSGTDLTASDIPSLSLSKISDVTATATEVNYISGVTSSVQTQLNNKVDKTTTASQVYGTDANGNQTTYGKDDFGKVDDVKVGTTSVVTNKVANLGTMAGESKDSYQVKITGAATSITSSNLTVNKALISDASGKVAVSSVSSTELGYLSGVTSAVQTQLNAKANDADISAVGKSNDYNDLDNKPTIGNATITFKANGTTISGQSFTTNATSDVEIDLGNTGLVDDVKINDTSIVTNKIAIIPIGTSSVLGVYKVNPNQGISAFSGGDLCIISASEQEITAKTNSYKPIVPNKLDKAIMEGLGNYGGTAWTDAYKYTARDTIGATQVILKDWD